MSRPLRLALCLAVLWPASSPAHRPRVRDLGITIGSLPTGALNAVTDVAGVMVGHVTLIEGSGDLVVGRGPVRTGVTAVLPHGGDLLGERVFAAAETINGNGEMTGMSWVNERGQLEVPVVLTNTLSVGEAYSGVVEHTLKRGAGRVPLPVVAECYDGGLNDIAGRHVTVGHVVRAIETASGGPVPEGSVGAGTGMRSYQFKAGIGTSSRVGPRRPHRGSPGQRQHGPQGGAYGRRGSRREGAPPDAPALARRIDHRGGRHRRARFAAPAAPPGQKGGVRDRPDRQRIPGDQRGLRDRLHHGLADLGRGRRPAPGLGPARRGDDGPFPGGRGGHRGGDPQLPGRGGDHDRPGRPDGPRSGSRGSFADPAQTRPSSPAARSGRPSPSPPRLEALLRAGVIGRSMGLWRFRVP